MNYKTFIQARRSNYIEIPVCHCGPMGANGSLEDGHKDTEGFLFLMRRWRLAMKTLKDYYSYWVAAGWI